MSKIKPQPPKCLWCRRNLRPVYERFCIDCGHKAHGHRFGPTSDQKTCNNKSCVCTNMMSDPSKFKKQLTGYGIQSTGLFHSLNCAVSWAMQFAPAVIANGGTHWAD